MVRVTLGLTLLALGIAVGSCADRITQPKTDPPDPTEDPSGALSDPVLRVASPSSELAYASLPPGSFPAGERAVIRSPRMPGTVTVAMVDGGFDAVPIAAAVGDLVEIEVQMASGPPGRASYRVPVRRRPRVVRTVPSRGKTDVPVNQSIVVAFSEPVAEATLASGIQLFRGETPVPGTVRLIEGTTAAASFEPASPLQTNTAYRLVVNETIRDLENEPLNASVTTEFTTGSEELGTAKSVVVLPDTIEVAIGSQVQMVATARDTNNKLVPGRPITWTSDAPAVAAVSATGLVTTHSSGLARIRARVDGVSDVALVIVSSTVPPVASARVAPESSTVLVGGILRLSVELKDAAGNVLRYRLVSWRSSAPDIVKVDALGGSAAVATRLAPGTATITASSEGQEGSATLHSGTVGPYTYFSVGAITCGLPGVSASWCWPEHMQGDGRASFTSLVPTKVGGGPPLTVVAAADAEHSCALDADGAAYCWGSNRAGQLGTGTKPPEPCFLNDPLCFSPTPVPVSGGLRFSTIAVDDHSCALAKDGRAYCWGLNVYGQLGLGSTNGPEQCSTFMVEGSGCSTAPREVAGGRTYAAVDAGYMHSCAVTTAGPTYCWGWNHSGVLGDNSPTQLNRPFPVEVFGGIAFASITTGGFHNCGLTSDGRAYCWGMNDYGQLGTGSLTGPQVCEHDAHPQFGRTNCSPVPVPVAGSLRFSRISAGFYHTCALSTTGVAYCWGVNNEGELGVGFAPLYVPSPRTVIGGLTFAEIDAGSGHTCGRTSAGILYCWGPNYQGQLGDGTTTPRDRPTRVFGQPQ